MSKAAHRTMRALAAAFGAAALSGCALWQTAQPQELPDPVALASAPMRKGTSGGVFVPENLPELVADKRALRPGEILTVLLQETTQASKKADTRFGKGSSVSVDPMTFRGKPLNTEVGASAKTDFSGSASSSQQNALTGAVTVVVMEVLPNGLLRVQGEKRVTINQGDETVRVSGYIRSSDVDAQNRVSSQRIANARISYSGQGSLANANDAGWLAKFFVHPFSPF